MKHLFKGVAMMLCGALLFSGCHKEIKQDIADLKTDTAALWAEIKALKTNLESTYVTKADLQLVSASVEQLQEAVKAVETLANSKADASALEAAIAEVKALLNGFVTPEDLAGYVTKDDVAGFVTEEELAAYATSEAVQSLVADLKAQAEAAIAQLQAQIEAIKGCECTPSEPVEGCDCDLEAVNSAIAELTEKLAGYQTTLDDFMTKTNEALEALQEEIEKINSEEFFAELYTYVDTQDKAILDAIAQLVADLAKANEALAAALEKAELALQTAQTALDKAGSGSSSAGGSCDCPDYTSSINSLRSQLAALEKELADLEKASGVTPAEVQSMIDAALAQYSGINAQIEEILGDIEYLSGKVADREIVSLILVPDVVVNGANAVKFNTVTYGDNLASSTATVTYRVNPSTADLSNTTLELVAHEAEIITKAAAALDYTYADGELKVTIKRGDVDGNMFAIAATTGAATVYSDYAQVYEVQHSAADFVFAPEEDEVTVRAEDGFNVAEQVYVSNFDVEAFGFTYAYSHELLSEEGTYEVVVEVKDGEAVVCSKALTVNLVGYAEANVMGVAERVAFETSDVKAWAVALKDAPNTIEIIKNAAQAAANKDIKTAYELLGGVPGFVKQTRTFEGFGTSYDKTAPVMATMAITIPDQYKDLYDQLPDNIKDLVNNMDEETLENLKDVVKDNPDIVEDIIGEVENAENITDILDILENENYKDIIDEVTGALGDVEIGDVISGGLGDAVVDMLPDALTSLIEKVESYLPSDVDLMGLIGKLVDNIGIENLGDLLSKAGELEGLIEEVKDYASNIVDLVKKLVDTPVVGDIVNKLIGDYDLNAIKNAIANLDINDLIKAESVANLKGYLKDLLSFVKDYLQDNMPDVDLPDVPGGEEPEPDQPDQPEVPSVSLEPQTLAEELAVEAAVVDFHNNIAAANDKLVANLANGNWGKFLSVLDNEYVATALQYVPEAMEALEALAGQASNFILYTAQEEPVVVDFPTRK